MGIHFLFLPGQFGDNLSLPGSSSARILALEESTFISFCLFVCLFLPTIETGRQPEVAGAKREQGWRVWATNVPELVVRLVVRANKRTAK